MSPQFLYMIDKNKIEKLVNDALKGTSLFAVEINIDSQNNIKVIIDGDDGVGIDKCVEVSRLIEGSLDREEEDFELGVSSYGIDKPILLRRQYNKYIDKAIELSLMDDSIKRGILESFNDSKLILKEEIVKKKGHKSKTKKMLTGDAIEIPFENIKLAKGVIVF